MLKRMKQQLCWKWPVGIAVIILVGGCVKNPSHAPEQTSTHPELPAESALVFQPVPEGDPLPDPVAETEVSEAAVKSISTEKPLLPSIDPNSPLAEVIKLADSGVEETVLLAYVSGAKGAFRLDPDAIIYLNDLGIPAPVIASMIEHDRVLRQDAANASAMLEPPAEVPPNEPVIASAPTYSVLPEMNEPAEGAIPVNYTSDGYAPPEQSNVSVSYFQDSLAPYGSWVDLEGYGRCWQPTVVAIDRNWRPYCDRGHWAYTDSGWYWVSDYTWGWAPFHYGRWFQHARLGWCWTPDTVWGPSWVSWRYSDDYCGWAPLPPRAHYTSAGFTYYGRPVSYSFNFGLGSDCYTFIPFNRFHERHPSRHALPREQVERVIHRTVVSTRITGDGKRGVMNQGIAPERVAAVTRREVTKDHPRSDDVTNRPHPRRAG
jgi:hypothetical protein